MPMLPPLSLLVPSGGAAVTRWVWRRLPIPAQGRFRLRWDLLMALVLGYIVLTVPLRIGFAMNDWRPWLLPDLLVDLLLVADMLLWSVTCYEVDGEEVRDLDDIRHHYLQGAFLVDFATAFPLELFVACFAGYRPWLRSNRLLRLLNMNYYFRLWEMVSFLKPSLIRLVNSCLVVLLLSHFIACAFFLVIVCEGPAVAQPGFTGHPDILSLPFYLQYLRAYYWAFVAMSGYNNTNPGTDAETLFYIVADLLGIFVVATVIGVVGDLIQNLDSSSMFFRQKIDQMNDYMRYKQIPADLQEEVRNYYTYLWRTGKGLEQNKVLEDLPPSLQGRLNVALNADYIKKVPLFSKCRNSDGFVADLVKCLKPIVCLPNSFVVRKGEVGTQMFFIHRGELLVVSDDDQVVLSMREGGFFGEIALLYDTKRTATIVAKTYCDLFILDKEDLTKVMKKWPEQAEAIRAAARERFQHIVEATRARDASDSDTASDPDALPFGSGAVPPADLRRRSGPSTNTSRTGTTSHRRSASYNTNLSVGPLPSHSPRSLASRLSLSVARSPKGSLSFSPRGSTCPGYFV